MSVASGQLHPLTTPQRDAANPDALVWLSASAGTGKTQVLTARVFRLLLRGDVEPENILCLTFTKAGAAEMANRIHDRLALWVRMDARQLWQDLQAIGHDVSRNDLDPARQLFAKILDAPGGGLKIMTIHSFCQTLLASFPLEAGMMPGFKALEERDQVALAREALAEMLVEAEKDGRHWLMQNLQAMSRDMGEEVTEKFLHRCARAPDVMAIVPEGNGAAVFARRITGVDFQGSAEAYLTAACDDDQFDMAGLRLVHDLNAGWGTKTGLKHCATIEAWIAATPEERAGQLGSLHKVWATDAGTVRRNGLKTDEYLDLAQAMLEHTAAVLEKATLIRYADRYAAALLVGKAYAERYGEAKRARGVVDFDDLIRNAARLLSNPEIGAWIRYKLDQRIDHILVDEAQDTNRAQWDIVEALAEEYFAGLGAHGDSVRTLFTVGDFKQAIFGFQGTSPRNYEDARDRLREKAENAGRHLELMDLSQSFRSTLPILQFVDAAIAEIGPEQLDLPQSVPEHISSRSDYGQVILLPPVRSVSSDGNSESEGSGDGEESWLSEEKRVFATNLAAQIARWLNDGLVLESGRTLEPGDIMVLVRSRNEVASLLVARLYAEGVPVSGIDRLRLSQPLAIQDLMAAIRFVLQPEDDLTLASLLVSPLMGWSQDDLLHYGYREAVAGQSLSLWRHLRSNGDLALRIAPLRDLLDRADFGTPYLFLEHILSGPMGGRSALHARMGKEALDPINELLNCAQQFETGHAPSLQSFLHWFDSSDVEIKREGDGRRNEVRVMTVHGSKGLQAPLVILADATYDPHKKRGGSVDLELETDGRLPMIPVRKADRIGQLGEAEERVSQREMEEHWRLLYVAMTRAEEQLVIGGVLGKRVHEPADDSWYAALARTMDGMGAAREALDPWGETRVWRGKSAAHVPSTVATADAAAQTDLPEWLVRSLPPETLPPRPLAPSNPGDTQDGDSPPSDAQKKAGRRGQLLHSLFERIAGNGPRIGKDALVRWLGQNASDLTDAEREEIAAVAFNVLSSEAGLDLFGSDALAEVPIAALVGETVVSGQIDRLLVRADRVDVVDFKTGRFVPSGEDQVPVGHLRQMAWYVAALETIYPNHRVCASLLYTHGPKRIELSGEKLAPHKPG